MYFIKTGIIVTFVIIACIAVFVYVSFLQEYTKKAAVFPLQEKQVNTTVPPCLFNEQKIRVGDVVCGMIVTSVSPEGAIHFKGEKTLNVFWRGVEGMGVKNDSIELRADSLYQLPYQEGDFTMASHGEGNVLLPSCGGYFEYYKERGYGLFQQINDDGTYTEEEERGLEMEGDEGAWCSVATILIDEYFYNDSGPKLDISPEEQEEMDRQGIPPLEPFRFYIRKIYNMQKPVELVSFVSPDENDGIEVFNSFEYPSEWGDVDMQDNRKGSENFRTYFFKNEPGITFMKATKNRFSAQERAEKELPNSADIQSYIASRVAFSTGDVPRADIASITGYYAREQPCTSFGKQCLDVAFRDTKNLDTLVLSRYYFWPLLTVFSPHYPVLTLKVDVATIRSKGCLHSTRYPNCIDVTEKSLIEKTFNDFDVSERWKKVNAYLLAGIDTSCFSQSEDTPKRTLFFEHTDAATQSCLFDEEKIHIGDIICGMKVTSIKPTPGGEKSIRFVGTKLLSVFFYSGEYAGGMEQIELRKQSRYKIPYQKEDNTVSENYGNIYSESGNCENSFGSFGISNEPGYEEQLEPAQATLGSNIIRIDSYTYNDKVPCEPPIDGQKEPYCPSAYRLNLKGIIKDSPQW